MIADIRVPDTGVVRQAEKLVRSVSTEMLFNHVMRCYWFGALFAQQQGIKVDGEQLFLSATLHDLGLTDHAPGPHRFEIESANAARTFMVGKGVPKDRAQNVWDDIALHTWDLNLFRGDTSRVVQFGIAYDVVGFPGVTLDRADVAVVLRRYPRLKFTRGFHGLMERELDAKQPYPHAFHPCSRIAHNRSPLAIEDLSVLQANAPFDE